MILLASASPRRRRLLREAGWVFRVKVSSYREDDRCLSRPSSLVRAHALGKALDVAGRFPGQTVVAADTVVWHGGRVIGKPRDLPHARRVLARLAGRWHVVYTGVAIARAARGRSAPRAEVYVETTRVKLKRLSPALLGAYLRRARPLDKAGAYAIQLRNPCIVESYRGSWSNAVGLPLESLAAHLKRFARRPSR